MSKDISEVAFIPDNISNISSQKYAFNEDTYQKISDNSLSKMTKNLNIFMDHQGLQVGYLKNSYQINDQAKKQENQNIIKQEQQYGRISFGKNSKIIIPKIQEQNIKSAEQNQQSSKNGFPFVTNKIQNQVEQFDSENKNNLPQGSNTHYVISQQTNYQKQKENKQSLQTQKSPNDSGSKKKVSFQQQNHIKTDNTGLETYPQTENQSYNVIQVDKYEEFQTEKGWLEHYVTANNKLLYQQTQTLLTYNQALINQIEKFQLRAKIIELQIETNKLKIALRKSPQTKHINFSIDFKINRSPILRIPKKINHQLRSYASQLQKTLIEARSESLQNEKTIQLLQFYEQQFRKKVNYAYIYQQYLLQKGNYTLFKNYKFQIDDISNKLLSKNKFQGKSKTKYSLKSINSFSNNMESLVSVNQSVPSFMKNLDSKVDQSTTSLANQLTKKNYFSNKKLSKKSIQVEKFSGKFSDQPSTNFYKSPSKQRIQLTHHKRLEQPSIKNIKDPQMYIFEPALFNSSNRSKKYFYYECQQYIKQLEKDYLFECEDQKRKELLTDERGFRQRELLRMKSQQMKDQILDTQVDVTTKQRQLKKENHILLRELELIQNQLALKSDAKQYPISTRTLQTQRQVKAPIKIRGSFQNDYELLYKQAEKKLNSNKSMTFLRNNSRSLKNLTQQNSLIKFITPQKRNIQRTLNSQRNQNSSIIRQKLRFSLQNKNQSLSKSKLSQLDSKQNKFLNRFKSKQAVNKIITSVKQIKGDDYIETKIVKTQQAIKYRLKNQIDSQYYIS